MNRRIQALAEQAGCTIDGMGYGEGNVEKFAELIVRECAVPMITQARAMDAHGGYKNNPVEVTAMNLHQGLLKHFGVEE